MSPEKDAYLCEKYPKMFVNRNKNIQQSCMAWGFEVSDGWFHIIDKTCALIQGHINWKRKERARDLRFNRALKKALAGDKSALIKHYAYNNVVTEWTLTKVEADITSGKMRIPTATCVQVTVDQVKEKFGTLRFYYTGGDEYISGITSMAEAMSSVTCEICGKPGQTSSGGWLKTTCKEHST
jgi:uncharacterized membrane protein